MSTVSSLYYVYGSLFFLFKKTSKKDEEEIVVSLILFNIIRTTPQHGGMERHNGLRQQVFLFMGLFSP